MKFNSRTAIYFEDGRGDVKEQSRFTEPKSISLFNFKLRAGVYKSRHNQRTIQKPKALSLSL
jgi:hypothetical protein